MVSEFRKLRKQYGVVFSLVIGVHTVVVINGLETLKDLFIKHGDITSSRGKNLMISDVCKYIDEQLLRCLTDLFVAGTDTSGIALRWFLLVFLHKPAIQESMYAEIQNEVSESKFPSMADRIKLPYCDSVLHEVLRFGNIAPLSVPHGLTKDIQFKGYLIPQHAMLVSNLDSVMNDPDLFENPFESIPTRFLSKDGNLTGWEKIPAFGIGRRICIGESLARMEVFLFSTALIQRFKFLPPEDCCLPSLLKSHMGETRSPLPFKLRAIIRR